MPDELRNVPALDPTRIPTQSLPWGVLKWLLTPQLDASCGVSVGEILLLPGRGHDRHKHDAFEQVLYVLSGRALQTVETEADDSPFPLVSGDVVYIPRGVFHSTLNTGWQPLRVLTIYSPGGGETELAAAPGYRCLSPGQAGTWRVDG